MRIPLVLGLVVGLVGCQSMSPLVEEQKSIPSQVSRLSLDSVGASLFDFENLGPEETLLVSSIEILGPSVVKPGGKVAISKSDESWKVEILK